MGKRSTTTTKSGKFMNPTDQARKEARRKELKKNKKTRMLVRATVLKNKNIEQILDDLRELDEQEYDPEKAEQSQMVEKVLKDKRQKLISTLDRVLKLYNREEPDKAAEVRHMIGAYEREKRQMMAHYEAIKQTKSVSLDEIPLPPMNFTEIPLPDDSSYPGMNPLTLFRGKLPPGPPPGRPPLKKFKQFSNLTSMADAAPGAEDSSAAQKRKSVRFNEAEQKMPMPASIMPPHAMSGDGMPSDIPMPPMQQPPMMGGAPPRFPPGNYPPPSGMMPPPGPPGAPSVLSAPPSIIQKTPQVTVIHQPTIQAKPQINTQLKAAATKFVPTALKVKREGSGHKVRSATEVAEAAVAAQENKKIQQKPVPTASKDEIYQQFMAEVSGLL